MTKFRVTTEVDIRDKYYFEIAARDVDEAQDIALELTADQVHSEAGCTARIRDIQPTATEEENDD